MLFAAVEIWPFPTPGSGDWLGDTTLRLQISGSWVGLVCPRSVCLFSSFRGLQTVFLKGMYQYKVWEMRKHIIPALTVHLGLGEAHLNRSF